jgi:6-phosphofructokinase 1
MAKKRIGILTGGGDVPGLNSVIKTVTYRSSEDNIEVMGLRRGWEALTHVNLDDAESRRRYLMPLDRENTRTIDRRGGTVLHSSRTNPAKMQKLPEHLAGKDFPLAKNRKGVPGNALDLSKQVMANLSTLGIEHLIAIGGDDTLGYAAKLSELGVKVIAIPKTMDNDVHNTEYCIGFSTAITRASDAIQRQRTTVASHERIGIFRVFGRDAGFTALYTAYTTSIRSVCSSRRSAQTQATMRWLCSAREPSGRAIKCASTARRTHMAIARRRALPTPLPRRSSSALERKR